MLVKGKKEADKSLWVRVITLLTWEQLIDLIFTADHSLSPKNLRDLAKNVLLVAGSECGKLLHTVQARALDTARQTPDALQALNYTTCWQRAE